MEWDKIEAWKFYIVSIEIIGTIERMNQGIVGGSFDSVKEASRSPADGYIVACREDNKLGKLCKYLVTV
jgi:hypothetical protein